MVMKVAPRQAEKIPEQAPAIISEVTGPLRIESVPCIEDR
jgi:hypothetical protein